MHPSGGLAHLKRTGKSPMAMGRRNVEFHSAVNLSTLATPVEVPRGLPSPTVLLGRPFPSDVGATAPSAHRQRAERRDGPNS